MITIFDIPPLFALQVLAFTAPVLMIMSLYLMRKRQED
jgi:hypothetical protein